MGRGPQGSGGAGRGVGAGPSQEEEASPEPAHNICSQVFKVSSAPPLSTKWNSALGTRLGNHTARRALLRAGARASLREQGFSSSLEGGSCLRIQFWASKHLVLTATRLLSLRHEQSRINTEQAAPWVVRLLGKNSLPYFGPCSWTPLAAMSPRYFGTCSWHWLFQFAEKEACIKIRFCEGTEEGLVRDFK